MARRDRSKMQRRAPPPAWQWVQQTAPPVLKTMGVVAGVALLLGVWLVVFVQRSPYFWVSAIDIQVEPGQRWMTDPRIGYRVHPPVHLLRADLRGLAAAIRREHPQFAQVVVRRELPNRLVAQVALREPIGQLRGRQYFLVDPEGTVLAPGSSTAWPGLPVIMTGSRTAAYEPGRPCHVPELRQVVAVLREVERSKALGARRVSAVRVSAAAPGSAGGPLVILVLDNGLELRTAPGEIGPRLARLKELLNSRRRELDEAQYVDLRFDDIVVGLRGED